MCALCAVRGEAETAERETPEDAAASESRVGRGDAFLAPAGKELVAAVALASILHDHLDDLHDPPPALSAMDADLIKLVNKLQDTFANLGASHSLHFPTRQFTCLSRRRTGHAPAGCGAFPDPI